MRWRIWRACVRNSTGSSVRRKPPGPRPVRQKPQQKMRSQMDRPITLWILPQELAGQPLAFQRARNPVWGIHQILAALAKRHTRRAQRPVHPNRQKGTLSLRVRTQKASLQMRARTVWTTKSPNCHQLQSLTLRPAKRTLSQDLSRGLQVLFRALAWRPRTCVIAQRSAPHPTCWTLLLKTLHRLLPAFAEGVLLSVRATTIVSASHGMSWARALIFTTTRNNTKTMTVTVLLVAKDPGLRTISSSETSPKCPRKCDRSYVPGVIGAPPCFGRYW